MLRESFFFLNILVLSLVVFNTCLKIIFSKLLFCRPVATHMYDVGL